MVFQAATYLPAGRTPLMKLLLKHHNNVQATSAGVAYKNKKKHREKKQLLFLHLSIVFYIT